MHKGINASLTLSGTADGCDTLYLDNGGNSGTGYSSSFSPCNSKVHSAKLFGQVLTNSCSLCHQWDAYSSSSKSLII